MSKKPLRKDKFGVQKVMRVKDYFGDSLGQLGLNIISGLVGQLTYFYTDKVGMAAGAIATVFLICKIIDAFTDLIMGTIVDHTKPGKEKYRPWLLKAGIPAGIMLVLLFSVPKTGSGMQLAYVMVTNILMTAVLYTAVCIPYNSLQAVRTNSQEERGIMGTWRAGAGYLAGMVIGIIIIPITNMLGGTQSAWIKVSVVFGLIMIFAFLICYITSRETATESGTVAEVPEDNEEAVPFKEAIKKLFHNKYWVIVLIVNFLANVSYGISGASGAYYCKWIYGNDNLVGILGVIGIIPTIIGFAIVGPVIKKFGIVKTLKISFGIGIVSNLLKIINPYHFVYNTVLGCFGAFSNIPMMSLLGVMTAMTIDYNEYKYGVKMVASSNSASGFGTKVGSGIGASMVGWCLGIVNYDPSLAVATTATKYAIFTYSIYIPLVLFILMYILIRKFDLEKTLPGMREEIEKRKASK